MLFDTKKIRDRSKKNWELEWKKTAELVKGKGKFTEIKKRGSEHLLWKYIFRIREILLKMGFDEVILNPIQPYEEVKKQYGPEAGAILDRLYYLATIPRPDIGLSNDKKDLIKKRLPNFKKFRELQEILKEYKRNEIEGGEDFTESLVSRLKIKTPDALYLINTVFKELLELKPEPTNFSLISHATTAWFPLLAELQDKKEHPIMLFSLVWRFRREQREDKKHLRAHLNFSMVVMDENFKIENGKELTEKFFKKLGFKDVKFEVKPNQPAYYAPGTNYEVFVKHKKIGWIEVSEIGMYSPVSLANYKIKYPVFNSGPGLGRIVMALENIKDIRELYYNKQIEFSDQEIAAGIIIDKKPETEEGKKIAEKILTGIIKNKDLIGKIRKKIYEGKVKVYVSEPEKGKKLLGPGGLNEIYVYKGCVLAVKPGDKKFEEILKKGVKVCSVLESISNYFAYQIEKGKRGRLTIKYADTLPSINLKMNKEISKYLADNKKEIKINAPIFIDIEIE